MAIANHQGERFWLACFGFYSGLSLFLISILDFSPILCEVAGEAGGGRRGESRIGVEKESGQKTRPKQEAS